MAGATDPSIATALEDQARALKMQAKTLDSTQKLLQQICERFDEQDGRWRELEHTVATNASELSTLQAKVDAADLECIVEDHVGAHVEAFERVAWHHLDDLAATTTTRVAALENVHQVFDAW
jgi:hypothetical protein